MAVDQRAACVGMLPDYVSTPPKEEGRVELMWGLCTVVHVDAAMWRNVHDVPCFGN